MAGRWVEPLDKYEGSLDGLSSDEVLRAKKAFLSLEEGPNGAAPSMSDVPQLLRMLGQAPSFHELREWGRQGELNGQLSLQRFLQIYAAHRRQLDALDDVVVALKSFDHNGDGTMDPNELTSAVTTLGDTLTEEEAAKLTALCDHKGRLSLAVLAKYLVSE